MTQIPQPVITTPPAKGRVKKLFLRGLVLLLPTMITVFLLVKAFQFLNEILIGPVNQGINLLLTHLDFYQNVLGKDVVYSNGVVQHIIAPLTRWFFEFAFGFGLSLLFVLVMGVALGTLFGRRLWAAIESRMTRVPLVRLVYPFIREMTDFVFTPRKQAFNSVVVVEYPRQGVWSLGFLTGEGFAELARRTGGDMVSVFLPASPTPMTGYLVFVPKKDIVPLDITVDDAFRLIISGGVITPDIRKDPEPIVGTQSSSPPSATPRNA